MTLHRRRLLRCALGLLAARSSSRAPVLAGSLEPVVLVRSPDGLVAIDPCTGEAGPVNTDLEALPHATPQGSPPADRPAHGPATIPVEGDIRYWVSAPDGAAFIALVTGSADAGWWYWRGDAEPRRLPLPVDLEPALTSGTKARWFHGATIDAEHLGSGALRLMAVDLADGAVVLDATRDRRLELAATAVSDDASLVAHVQGGNTRVDIWTVDLRHEAAPIEVEVTVPIDPAAPVAPGAIDLRVARSDCGAVIAVGLSWAWSEHPDPMVIIVSTEAPAAPLVTTAPGELIGIVEEGFR